MEIKHTMGSEILRKQKNLYTLQEMGNNMGTKIKIL